MDMTLNEVRILLGLDLRQKADCTIARITLDEHLGHVHQRLKELKTLKKNRWCCASVATGRMPTATFSKCCTSRLISI